MRGGQNVVVMGGGLEKRAECLQLGLSMAGPRNIKLNAPAPAPAAGWGAPIAAGTQDGAPRLVDGADGTWKGIHPALCGL